MRDRIAEWVQEGELFVWRYANPNRYWRGWHFSADPAGCGSIYSLLDRMAGGPARHRTLKLGQVTRAIWALAYQREAKRDNFASLRVAFDPVAEDMSIAIDGERLIMTLDDQHVSTLRAAFAKVAIGHGDFGISTSKKRGSDHWMFWWTPGPRDHGRKQ